MAVGSQRDGGMRYPTSGRFITGPIGLVGHGKPLAVWAQARQPCHQRRFGQALQVNHRIVGLRLQLQLEQAPGLARLLAEHVLAPATQFTGDDTAYAFAAAQQRRKTPLDNPVNPGCRKRLPNILHRCHGVHHVAKR